MWVRFFILCVITLPLCGCASFSSAPPTCDGMARRPLNRSLWDWEAATALSAPQAPAAPSSALMRKAETRSSLPPSAPSDKPNASGEVDIASSYRSCGKES